MTLADLSATARGLADALRAGAAAPCQGFPSCFEAEQSRPPARGEKRFGWTRRPLWAFDGDALCLSCSARWNVERAAEDLHTLRDLRAREPAAAPA